MEFEGRTYSAVIESNVWIGANVTVLSGSHIGTGCVIAAGAVVVGEIPAYTVAGGCPARVLSHRRRSGTSDGVQTTGAAGQI